jgi:hypothetical protein
MACLRTKPPPTADDAYHDPIGEVGAHEKSLEFPVKSDGHPSILRHLDSRIVVLTLLNGLLYWPWRWLRVAFDAGDHL